MMRKIFIAGCLAAPVAVSVMPVAHAQDAPKSGAIEEVIVTAERRSTSVQDVGFSIMALSGDQLAMQQIHSATDLAALVPGFYLNTSDHTQSLIQIRGNNATFRNAMLDSPTGFFVDDVYYPSQLDFNTNLYDMDHVEIIRGPQGTLFGRNIVGGAVTITTKKPTFGQDYLASVSVGNGGYVRTEGVYNDTIVPDVLAGRLAFSTENSSGLEETPNLKGSHIFSDSFSVRGKLLYTPTSTLSIVLSADYTHTNGDGQNTQLFVTGPLSTIPATLGTYGKFYTGPWQNSEDIRVPFSYLQRGVNLNADWNVLGGTLTSITALRVTDNYTSENSVNIAGPRLIGVEQIFQDRQFTQEVRFASAPSRLSYVVGLYFLDGFYHSDNLVGFQGTIPSVLTTAGLIKTDSYNGTDRDQRGVVVSVAGFGEANFDITDQFTAVLGGRYTIDVKTQNFSGTSFGPAGTVPLSGFVSPVFVHASHTWYAFTPKFELKYKPTEDVNLYLLFSRGYSSGGFIDTAFVLPAAATALNPEKSQNMEAGIKSLWFGRRVQFNLDVFNQITTNLQNFSSTGGVPHSYNASARVTGVELESAANVIDNLSLTFNAAYNYGIYTNNVDSFNGVVVNYTGHLLKYLPRWAFTLAGQYVWDLGDGQMATFSADYEWNSQISSTDDGTMRNYETLWNATAGGTLNAQFQFESEDSKWLLQLWGKNLANNYQIAAANNLTSFVVPVAGGPNSFWLAWNKEPRRFGITLTYRK